MNNSFLIQNLNHNFKNWEKNAKKKVKILKINKNNTQKSNKESQNLSDNYKNKQEST